MLNVQFPTHIPLRFGRRQIGTEGSNCCLNRQFFKLDYTPLYLVPLFQIGGKVKSVAGKPGEVIVTVADEEKAFFIICGSRGKGTLRRTLLGSISDYVLHHSHVPVFICKHKDLHKEHGGSASPSLKHRIMNSPLFRRKNKDSPKNSPKLDRKSATDSDAETKD